MAEGDTTTSGKVTLLPATAIVVGNMVGTGVFVSLGYQLAGMSSGFAILVLWILGGLCSLCGALCYGELAALLPRSGGEYHFLSKIYHPAVGFVAGCVSMAVGFAAPIAIAAMAFGEYATGITMDSGAGRETAALWLSCGLVVAVAGIHLFHIEVGSRFQSLFTAGKVILIVILIAAAFLTGRGGDTSFHPTAEGVGELFSSAFAVSLVWVMYSYTGWNAATYIVNEIRDPRRLVPRALFIGTALVTTLYVALNAAFLYSTPAHSLEGKLEVGLVVAREIFGTSGGNLMAGLISFGLISAVSAMTWAGPRVASTMGEDYPLLRWLTRRSRRGIPHVAILFQTAIALLLLQTASFEDVVVYTGLLLFISSFLTVGGVIVLRFRQPELKRPVRTWGYPVTPLLFLAVQGWMMVYVVKEKPVVALWSAGTLVLAFILFTVAERGAPQKRDQPPPS